MIYFILLLILTPLPHAKSIEDPKYTNQKPAVSSIKLNDDYIYPEEKRVYGDNCFANNLIEVANGKQIRVAANRMFIVYINTEFGETYYNLQQYYGENLDDITFSSIALSTKQEESEYYSVEIPLTLKCKYNLHPFFRLKAFASIKFYQDNTEQKYQFNFLLLCAKQNQIEAFTNFYIPGYIMFWMLFNLSLQIYHNQVRTFDHLITFIVYFIASLIIDNDLLAYFMAGLIHLLVVFREHRLHNIKTKTFVLYLVFMTVVALQILLTFQGTKSHYLWNSFWIALDNFIILHISMFLTLRLVKLNRVRHVFWYFLLISIFSALYHGHNRFFQLQFKNPLNLQCVKISVFFPIMMLPISNFLSTMRVWMNRVMAIAIIFISAMPLSLQIQVMSVVLMGALLYQIARKNMSAISHRC